MLKQSLLSLALLSLSALMFIPHFLNHEQTQSICRGNISGVLSELLVPRRIQSQSKLAGHQAQHWPDLTGGSSPGWLKSTTYQLFKEKTVKIKSVTVKLVDFSNFTSQAQGCVDFTTDCIINKLRKSRIDQNKLLMIC